MGLQTVYGDINLRFVSDIDKNASTLLAHHHPNVPNLGDLTIVEWADIEAVDVLCAGYPCQPFSYAGYRKGEQDERAIFEYIADALAFYDPETCCWRMSQGTLLSERPPLLQYLPNWGTTQNGALFELRTPAHLIKERGYLFGAKLKTPTASENVKPRPHRVDGDRYDLADQLGKLLPTPQAWDANRGPDNSQLRGDGKRPSGAKGTVNLAGALKLLPTPVVNDMGNGKTIQQWQTMINKWPNGHHGNSLNIEAQKLIDGDSTKQQSDAGKQLWDE